MVALVDLDAMHAVDREKIAKHEAVRPVHRVEGAAHDALPGVKTPAGAQAALPDVVRRHGLRLKRNAVVAVTLVKPPALVKEPALALEAREQGCSWKWREVIEGGEIKAMLDRERGRFVEGVRALAVVAEHEGAVDADAVAAQVGERDREAAAHGVEALFHGAQHGFVEALETDENAAAAGARKRGEERLVMRRIDAHLGDPADAERCQRLGEIARKRQIGREIVVDEEEQLLLVLEARDLRHDGVDRTMARGALEEGLHGAEVAWEAAATAGLDQPDAQIAAAAEQRAVVAHLAEIG